MPSASRLPLCFGGVREPARTPPCVLAVSADAREHCLGVYGVTDGVRFRQRSVNVERVWRTPGSLYSFWRRKRS